MTKTTEFTTSTTLSSDDLPFYLKYPTIIFDRDMLHRTVSPLLDKWSFEPTNIGKYLADVSEDIAKCARFDEQCKKNMKNRLRGKEIHD